MTKSKLNRRQFLKKSGSLAVGASVLGSLQPSVYARGGNTIRLALLGCGGRGTGAVGDALNVKGQGPVKLYATADLAIDILRPGDVAMCTTRSYIRPLHVEYAIKKGINVFFEKPFASDPGGLHRLLRSDKIAKRKNLKIAAGLQCRHSPARQALIEKIRNGEMGDIPLIRANRLGGTRSSAEYISIGSARGTWLTT
ncbi:MAG: Gfo/Idh/MocA family protein [Planctomycetota bacterium]|jgi:predicted dehydrogenase